MTKSMLSESPRFTIDADFNTPAGKPAGQNSPAAKIDSRIALELIGISPATQLLREAVQQAVSTNGPLLIYGEQGTGKGFAARIIHVAGRQACKPFIALDCSVLTTEAFRKSLFGNRGVGNNNGVLNSLPGETLQQADGGTLLLKNIDLLAMPLQNEIGRLLRTKVDDPTQAGHHSPYDLRILATVKADSLGQIRRRQIDEGLLRELSRRSIAIPPLRERLEDLGLFTEHFLQRNALREGRPAKRVTLMALELLESHHWPGNLHQLQNVIERSCQLDFEPKLTAEMIRPWLADQSGKAALEFPGLTLKEMERKLIETTFTRCQGNRERTAKILNIGLRTLSGKLREYGYPPRGGPGSNLNSLQRKAA